MVPKIVWRFCFRSPFQKITTMDRRPLGIFDSGVGGLSVTREIIRVLPHEDLIYFSDSGNCPYGTRPAGQIQRLSRAVAEFLFEKGSKALVVACNTASTASVAFLRDLWPETPIVGMVPAIKPAALTTKTGKIGVLATEATSRAAALKEVIDRFAGDRAVLVVAPPGLVELVESGQAESPETRDLLKKHLEPLLEQGVDTLVLGCTHFPFLRPALKQFLSPEVQIIDSGEAVARQTRRILEKGGLLNPGLKPGEITFFTSGDPLDQARVIASLMEYEKVPPVHPARLKF